jgi:hypothetical protein
MLNRTEFRKFNAIANANNTKNKGDFKLNAEDVRSNIGNLGIDHVDL